MSYKLIFIEKSHVGLIYFKNKLLSIVMEHNLYRINDIYLGKVSALLPSLDAAFITLNPKSKNGFISFDHINTSKSITPNKNILVQITREPVGTKGPNVSSDINIVGKYLSFLPFSKSVNIIKKNHYDQSSREYLKALGRLLVNSRDSGILMKPESIYANTNFLIKEIRILQSRWRKILHKSSNLVKPSLLSKKKDFIQKIFEDYSNINFDFIATDSHGAAIRTKKILSQINNSDIKKNITIEFHKTNLDLIKCYLIDVILAQIMRPRVNLSKGGYIIIEKTEALTSIDVNSGSSTNFHNPRQANLWVNYAAVQEIARQIKLRNIGGIIIVDFIDSTNQTDQMKLLRYINKLIKKDYIKSTVIQMSELGLVEITRARYGQSVYDAFGRKCNICNGLGYLNANLIPTQNLYYELKLSPISIFQIDNRIQILYS
jgi:ribonuclease E